MPAALSAPSSSALESMFTARVVAAMAPSTVSWRPMSAIASVLTASTWVLISSRLAIMPSTRARSVAAACIAGAPMVVAAGSIRLELPGSVRRVFATALSMPSDVNSPPLSARASSRARRCSGDVGPIAVSMTAGADMPPPKAPPTMAARSTSSNRLLFLPEMPMSMALPPTCATVSSSAPTRELVVTAVPAASRRFPASASAF